MKKIDRSFRTVMALFICFVSVLLAIAPAVSYIAGTPDSLMSMLQTVETPQKTQKAQMPLKAPEAPKLQMKKKHLQKLLQRLRKKTLKKRLRRRKP